MSSGRPSLPVHKRNQFGREAPFDLGPVRPPASLLRDVRQPAFDRRGEDRAGHHGVHGDAGVGERTREARRQIDHRCLGRLVFADVALGLRRRGARDIDDAAEATRLHSRYEGVSEPDGGADVLLERADPVVPADVEPGGVARHGLATGVVDEDVDTADDPLDLAPRRESQPLGVARSPRTQWWSRRTAQSCSATERVRAVAAVHDDHRAFRRQHVRDPGADPGTAAGDERSQAA